MHGRHDILGTDGKHPSPSPDIVTRTGPVGAWTAALAADLVHWSAHTALMRSLRRMRMLANLPRVRRLLASPSLAAHAAAEGQGDALFYLSSRHYLARGTGARARIASASCHYINQDHLFTESYFRAVYSEGEGLCLWRHPVAAHDHDIVLCKGRDVADEGALSLIFRVDGGIHCVLSFACVPGWTLQTSAHSPLPDHVWFITRKHLTMRRDYQADFHRAFHRVSPAQMVLSAFSGMVQRLGGNVAVAIGSARQPSNTPEHEEHFIIAYDDFWLACGAKPMGRDYLLPLPLPHRSPDGLPSRKRKRARLRQEVQHEVEKAAFDTISRYLVRG